jgi:3-deoxy-manno-octulosonate cytidylyltransferase (CMP-KDO synthetase)
MLAQSGKPLFLHTYDQARRARAFAHVYVATDSDEVEAAAVEAGADVIRTSPAPRTGSERCAEAAADLHADVVVDVQGDWPEVDPADLDRLAAAVGDGPLESPTATLAVRLHDARLAADPNVVKVVRDRAGDAMYFSRSPIPHGRRDSDYPVLRHVGVYAFTREVLLRIPSLPSTGLAETEGLEQLRFLENGIGMRVLDATSEPWGIETSDDYQAFLRRVRERQGAGP